MVIAARNILNHWPEFLNMNYLVRYYEEGNFFTEDSCHTLEACVGWLALLKNTEDELFEKLREFWLMQ